MWIRRLAPIFILLAGCSGASEDAPRGAERADQTPSGNGPSVEEPPLPPREELIVSLTPESVGCLRIGMTPDEVRTDCTAARDTAIELEGMRQPALAVEVGVASVLAELVDGEVWRIRVSEPGAVTEDGLQVGSPASRVAALEGARVNTGEGRYFVTASSHCGLSFAIEGVPFDGTAQTVQELRSSPESVRVSEILVLGAPAADCG